VNHHLVRRLPEGPVDPDARALARGRGDVGFEVPHLGSFREGLDLAHLKTQIRKLGRNRLAGREKGRRVQCKQLALSNAHQLPEGIRRQRHEGPHNQ